MDETRDEFLSEEDLDLRDLSDAELVAYWTLWLTQAQVTNDLDEAFYSHGVFERDPAVPPPPLALTDGGHPRGDNRRGTLRPR